VTQPSGRHTVQVRGSAGVATARPKLGEFTVYLLDNPLPPFVLQNLGNKGVILPLCARSSSLKELHAKSREHWSYGRGAISRFGKARAFLERDFGSRAIAGVRLSKSVHYP